MEVDPQHQWAVHPDLLIQIGLGSVGISPASCPWILGVLRGPNKVPLHSMVVVALVTVTFILVGEINTLAPVVTMPFLLTYASIDYAYFALAQTFDIQHRREERFSHSQTFQPAQHQGGYGTTKESSSEVVHKFGNDLDMLFPERTRHKKGMGI
uniref:Solute carrier family 12 member 8 n=1 Tax=Timema poppense TaxID=170557 RepID=A0A7R9GXQ8_TIMPO|nr:unnamed protein product [Timema poppensis]